jgi:hypothetical protein
MTFTDAGVSVLLDFLNGASATEPTHFGVGTGSTASATTDTTLEAEVARQTIDTKSVVAPQITFSTIIPSTACNGETLREAGLLNDPTTGSLFTRFTHGAITKTSSIEVEYEIVVRIIN